MYAFRSEVKGMDGLVATMMASYHQANIFVPHSNDRHASHTHYSNSLLDLIIPSSYFQDVCLSVSLCL